MRDEADRTIHVAASAARPGRSLASVVWGLLMYGPDGPCLLVQKVRTDRQIASSSDVDVDPFSPVGCFFYFKYFYRMRRRKKKSRKGKV